jgi:fucose 4-O-acetylase-like acetyltransferase
MERRSSIENNRSAAIDVAKLVAAAAVVWIHVTDCDESRAFIPLCRFAVPFFTAAAVFFVLRKTSAPHGSLIEYVRQRAQRLYIPFLIWAAFYLVVRFAKHGITGGGSPIIISPAMLLNGTAHHLWFLPFIFLASLLAYGVGTHLGKPSLKRAPLFGLLALAAGIGFANVPCPVLLEPTESPISYFIDHAWDVTPSIFFGAALYWWSLAFKPDARWRWPVLALGLAAAFFEFRGGDSVLASHVAGMSLLIFSLAQPERAWMCRVRPYAEFAFVIYLVHVFFIESLRVVWERLGMSSSLTVDFGLWAVAIVGSVITGKLLSQTRALRWVVPR